MIAVRRSSAINVAGLDELAGAFDSELAAGSSFTEALTDIGKKAAAQATRAVAVKNRAQLEGIGRDVANSAIFAAIKGLPGPVRTYLQPDYVPPPPSPKWVSDMIDPLVVPISDGAKDVAIRFAKKLSWPAGTTIALIVLTLFGGGYILGSVVTRQRVRSAGAKGLQWP